MDIQQLRYFVEICKTGNLTKAAQALHVSQPALSKTLKNMERYLGVQLFENDRNHLILTDTGHALALKAQYLILDFDNIIDSIHDVQNLKTGKITLGIPMLISFLYFCDILQKFKNKYPGVNLDIIEIGDDAIVEKVRLGNIDIGIVTRPLISSDFVSVPIFTDEVVAFLPESNGLAGKGTLEFYDLKEQCLHMFSSDFSLYGQVITGCQNAGFQPNISSTSSQRTFLVAMAELTNGIAILPRPLVANMEIPSMRILPFKPRFVWTISIILKENKYITYAMRTLLDDIEAFFSAQSQRWSCP